MTKPTGKGEDMEYFRLKPFDKSKINQVCVCVCVCLLRYYGITVSIFLLFIEGVSSK